MKNIEFENMVETSIAALRQSIANLEKDLATPVLEDGHVALVEDGNRVYGEWTGGKGYKHLDTLPGHLCGIVHFSSRSVEKNRAAKSEAQFIHIRAFKEIMLARWQKSLVNLERTLVTLRAQAPVVAS